LLFIYLFDCLFVRSFIHPSIHSLIRPSIRPSVHLSLSLSLSLYLSIYSFIGILFSIDMRKKQPCYTTARKNNTIIACKQTNVFVCWGVVVDWWRRTDGSVQLPENGVYAELGRCQ